MAQPAAGGIVVYETPDGEVRVDVRLERETVWLSLTQMAELFGRDKSVISRHLRNVFESSELERAATVARNATVQREGGRDVVREIEFFNLDAILSVGYRVNSKRGTQFRIWATHTLREHLVRGYTLNRQRFEQNASELEAALALVRKAAAGDELTTAQGRGLVDIIARYTQTFLLLQRYDQGLLVEPKGVRGGRLPSADEARADIRALKSDLMKRGEATELFGREWEDALAALLGNLDQSVFGEPAYPTIEAKAAHLLYFVIKNHPFTDGNKRIGSFLFVDFLHRKAAVSQRRAGDQRCGAGRARAARGRIRAEGQGRDDSPRDEHARGRRLMSESPVRASCRARSSAASCCFRPTSTRWTAAERLLLPHQREKTGDEGEHRIEPPRVSLRKAALTPALSH